MDVDVPTLPEVDPIVDLWIDLAADQRRHGSHVLPAANRTRIRESMVRHAVNGTVLVARRGRAPAETSDDLAGFVTFTVERGTYELDVDRGVVENLYVVPTHRGQGVGAGLLAAAESALADRGVDVLSLEAMADNERARSFYRDHGYAPHRVALEKSIGNDTHSKGEE